jgi:hypothetical protein
LFDTRGEWIGWLANRDVYNLDGFYVGYLSEDGRIVRPRIVPSHPRRPLPPAPMRARPPAKVPLPPMFAELPWRLMDVFEEEPEVFGFISDLRPDWED